MAFRVDVKLTPEDAKRLQAAMRGNARCFLTKEGRPIQTGPGGQKGWWVTSNNRRIFITRKSRQRHQQTVGEARRAMRGSPRWLRDAGVGEVQVRNVGTFDRMRVRRRSAVVAGWYDGRRVVVKNGWLRQNLRQYDMRNLIAHEGAHAVTSRGRIWEINDSRRPEAERNLINQFMSAVQREDSDPTPYARSYRGWGDTFRFHENFAEWSGLYTSNRGRYNRIAKRYPRTATAYRNLSRYYGRNPVRSGTAKAANVKQPPPLYLDSRLRMLPNERNAAYVRIVRNGKWVLAALMTPEMEERFNKRFGGKGK